MKIVRYRPYSNSYRESTWLVFKIVDASAEDREQLRDLLEPGTCTMQTLYHKSVRQGYVGAIEPEIDKEFYDLLWIRPNSTALVLFLVGWSDRILGSWDKIPN